MPSTEQRDLRTLLRDRHQWVKMRTRLQHTLQAIVLNHGLRQGHALWSAAGQSALHRQVMPTDNATFGIPQRTSSYVELTVHAIGSTAAILKLKWLPSFKRAPPGVDRARKVIRMKSVCSSPNSLIPRRLAELF
jgi:hypothetical protein